MFIIIKTFKILFLNSPAIAFSLDTVYWAGRILVFLINISNLSIRK